MLLVHGDSGEPTTAAIALASGVEELSDGGLVQLMTEMNDFDALPATEPEPVLAVDSTDGFNQD